MMRLTQDLTGILRIVNGGGKPLVIAVHGGTYTSRYFDLPGRSLLAVAAANGFDIVAIDRPGYAGSAMLGVDCMDIAGQASFLVDELSKVWQKFGEGHDGLFLIGHSIGAAIAAMIASAPGALPVIGLAISGVGLQTNPGDHERWAALPDLPMVAMPAVIKDLVMFGPAGSFDADMPQAGHVADAAAPKAELLSITGSWAADAPAVLGRITVPVHYRQAEFDRLWIVEQAEIDGFAKALTSSPLVDARMVPRSGHCIDHHRAGPALHLQQLGFALECAARL